MENHVKVIAILWIIFGILGILLACLTFFLLFGLSFIPDMDYEGRIILKYVALGGSIFIALLSIPEIIGGIGLLKRKEWGRIVTLAVAFLALLSIPIGTALGIYTLVILLNNETTKLFKPDKAG